MDSKGAISSTIPGMREKKNTNTTVQARMLARQRRRGTGAKVIYRYGNNAIVTVFCVDHGKQCICTTTTHFVEGPCVSLPTFFSCEMGCA